MSATRATNNTILVNIHPLSIIREVRKYPVLYSRRSRECGNGYLKKKIWYKVAKSVITDWDSYTDEEKDSKVKGLCKRWRNLRDTFKRQVELEKKAREGIEIKKKPYVYYNHMRFLLPHVTSLEDTQVPEPDPDPKLEGYFMAEKTMKPEEINNKRNIEQHFIDGTPIGMPRLNLKTCETYEIDEDRHFALSLIPTLKKMSDDEKLIAKMEILKVLRKVRSQSTREEAEDVVYCVEDGGSSIPVKIEFLEEEATEEAINVSEDSDNSE